MNRLRHGMLLDAKHVMDNAMPDLQDIRTLVPECLHNELERHIRLFEDTLCAADVSGDYQERETLCHIGALMANLCSNISQESWPFSQRDREVARELYKRWDEAVREVPVERRKP